MRKVLVVTTASLWFASVGLLAAGFLSLLISNQIGADLELDLGILLWATLLHAQCIYCVFTHLKEPIVEKNELEILVQHGV